MFNHCGNSRSLAPCCHRLPGQTDKPAAQQESWITEKNLSAPPPSLQSGGFLLFHQRTLPLSLLSLANLKWFCLPIFSGMAKTWITFWEHPGLLFHVSAEPQNRASRCIVHVRVCTVHFASEVSESESVRGSPAFCEGIHWRRRLSVNS